MITFSVGTKFTYFCNLIDFLKISSSIKKKICSKPIFLILKLCYVKYVCNKYEIRLVYQFDQRLFYYNRMTNNYMEYKELLSSNYFNCPLNAGNNYT